MEGEHSNAVEDGVAGNRRGRETSWGLLPRPGEKCREPAQCNGRRWERIQGPVVSRAGREEGVSHDVQSGSVPGS